MGTFTFANDGATRVPASAMKLMATLTVEEAAKTAKKPGAADPGAEGVDPEVDSYTPRRVKIDALSGAPIEHPYWGKIVHDLSGVDADPQKIPLDFAHQANDNPNCAIGYCLMAEMEVDDKGLHYPAMIVPYPKREDDVATEVLYKMDQGVPYQSSIDWRGDGVQLQHVDENEVTEVNGRAFVGPGIVVRKWPLRGTAVCTYGADCHTATSFSDAAESYMVQKVSGPVTKAVPTPEVKTTGQEKPISASEPEKTAFTSSTGDSMAEQAKTETKTEVASATGTSAIVEQKPADVKPDIKALSKQFTDAFGDKGAGYFCQGMSFEQATAEHSKFTSETNKTAIAAKEAEIAQLKATNETLQKQLSSAPRGNDAAAPSAEAPKQGQQVTTPAKALNRTYSDGTPFGTPNAGLQLFINSIKVPTSMNDKKS